jgi:hypothetical protein
MIPTMKRRQITWLMATAGAGYVLKGQHAQAQDPDSSPDSSVVVGAFSAESAGALVPSGWDIQTFRSIPKPTDYELVQQQDQVVLRAISEASSSGLTRRVRVDLRRTPLLKWRWRVDEAIQQGDLTQRDTDACSARVYVTFGRVLLSTRALCYAWSSSPEAGSLITSPITGQVKNLVIQDQSAPLQEWLTEERNVFLDFRDAFGEVPPEVSGVAILTDGFRTNERAVAYYGDIAFGSL